jgi:hypothetical protein
LCICEDGATPHPLLGVGRRVCGRDDCFVGRLRVEVRGALCGVGTWRPLRGLSELQGGGALGFIRAMVRPPRPHEEAEAPKQRAM